MNLLFWIYKLRVEATGQASIMVRLTHQSKRVNINSGMKIQVSTWDSKRQRVKGTSEQAKQINHYLQTTQIRIMGIYDELLKSNKSFSVTTIRDKFIGKGEKVYTLCEVVSQHNTEMKQLLGKVYAQNTYRKYVGFETILKLFLKEVIKNVQLPVNEINLPFITKLEHYFRTVRKSNSNSATKRLQQLKKILRYGRMNGFVNIDPFINFTLKLKPTTRLIITKEELANIQSFEPITVSQKRLKDVYLFQCYTGLAHVDLYKLNVENIHKGDDGKLWIIMNRTKTGTSIRIPLLPIPQMILNKYAEYSLKNGGKLLPVPTNQNMNRNLKKLGEGAGITKNLTTHMARHCFATTVTLANGVPIEVVSRLLAHTNIRTTQIYAKVLDNNLSDAIDKLKERLNIN